MNNAPIPLHTPRKRFALTDVRAGRLDMPRRVLGYGQEGVGKSTFAAGAPSPVFMCPENGTPHLNIQRLPTPETWDDALEIASLLVGDGTGFETLVIDPVNWLELLCWGRVIGGPGAAPNEDTADAIAQHGGGFNKGYDAAVSHWRNMVGVLERVWRSGKNVVLLGHSHVKAFNDPTGVSYDRYELQMHHKASGLLKQWADDVLFMRHEVLAKAERGKVRAVATGARVMHTQWDRAWDAKTRAALPEELPLSWADYWSAVEAGKDRAPALREEIRSLLPMVEASTRSKVEAAMVAAGDSADRLAEIANRVRVITASALKENDA